MEDFQRAALNAHDLTCLELAQNLVGRLVRDANHQRQLFLGDGQHAPGAAKALDVLIPELV